MLTFGDRFRMTFQHSQECWNVGKNKTADFRRAGWGNGEVWIKFDDELFYML